MKAQPRLQEWSVRGLIAIVLLINLVCATDFIVRPQRYMASYELSGEVGKAVIIGYGILFLMWQVPYFFAFYHPTRNRISLISAVLMQTIGLVGESFLLGRISLEHQVLRGSVLRFIYFDAGGLLLLLIALIILYAGAKHPGQ